MGFFSFRQEPRISGSAPTGSISLEELPILRLKSEVFDYKKWTFDPQNPVDILCAKLYRFHGGGSPSWDIKQFKKGLEYIINDGEKKFDEYLFQSINEGSEFTLTVLISMFPEKFNPVFLEYAKGFQKTVWQKIYDWCFDIPVQDMYKRLFFNKENIYPLLKQFNVIIPRQISNDCDLFKKESLEKITLLCDEGKTKRAYQTIRDM